MDEAPDRDFAESVRIHKRLRGWYRRWGYQTLEVPRTGVEQRMGFVLGCVERALARLGDL